uniref:SH3 domain-containing protein n=1 Tax=Parastrongyloides trichosuri TaxID=131310 RepID=A0A0N4Z2Q2_PARTI
MPPTNVKDKSLVSVRTNTKNIDTDNIKDEESASSPDDDYDDEFDENLNSINVTYIPNDMEIQPEENKIIKKTYENQVQEENVDEKKIEETIQKEEKVNDKNAKEDKGNKNEVVEKKFKEYIMEKSNANENDVEDRKLEKKTINENNIKEKDVEDDKVMETKSMKKNIEGNNSKTNEGKKLIEKKIHEKKRSISKVGNKAYVRKTIEAPKYFTPELMLSTPSYISLYRRNVGPDTTPPKTNEPEDTPETSDKENDAISTYLIIAVVIVVIAIIASFSYLVYFLMKERRNKKSKKSDKKKKKNAKNARELGAVNRKKAKIDGPSKKAKKDNVVVKKYDELELKKGVDDNKLLLGSENNLEVAGLLNPSLNKISFNQNGPVTTYIQPLNNESQVTSEDSTTYKRDGTTTLKTTNDKCKNECPCKSKKSKKVLFAQRGTSDDWKVIDERDNFDDFSFQISSSINE